MVAYSSEAFDRLGIDRKLLATVDFVVEELFTNMVKYAKGSTRDVRMAVTAIEGGVEVTLTDYDVEPFDVTRAPDVDVGAPIEARRPGGLGLHLIRRMVDAIEYVLELADNKAGDYTIEFESFDDAIASTGNWDEATCASNARTYVEDESIVGVIGTYNSGCAAIITAAVTAAERTAAAALAPALPNSVFMCIPPCVRLKRTL